MGSIQRRLVALEDRKPAPDTAHDPEARARVRAGMTAFFAQLTRLRRGELDPQEAESCRAMCEALEARVAEMRHRENRRGGR